MAGEQPKHGPRPDVDEHGRIPLHYLASHGDAVRVKTLLENGANPCVQDDKGWTPLHFAAQDRRDAVVAVLLENGADPNLADVYGNGPLWTAVLSAKGDNKIVELLLKKGADPHRKNQHGRSPYEMAMTIGHGLETPFRRISQVKPQ